MIHGVVDLILISGFFWALAPRLLDYSDRRAEARRQHHIPEAFFRVKF